MGCFAFPTDTMRCVVCKRVLRVPCEPASWPCAVYRAGDPLPNTIYIPRVPPRCPYCLTDGALQGADED